MELKNSFKTLNYMRKILTSDTEHILPFPTKPQKPIPQGKSPLPLPRCTPQQADIPPAALDSFFKCLSSLPNGWPHSCIVVRYGKVVCEGSWAPYSTSRWHVTHSLCKSFTSTAIGMLWDEGKVDLDEKICSIFPEKCNLMVSRRARNLTVRHLLTMSSGSTFREAGAVAECDWLRAFLESEFEFEPGTQMDYNSMNTYVLSAVLKKKSGCGLMEYLQPRLFEPLGFGDVAWEKCPNGIEKGGWGMYVYLEDAVKLGLLYLSQGMWNGQQLLSKEWVDQATTSYMKRESGEEYGYQIWTDAQKQFFMFNGMFGQYVIVCPSLELVIGINAGAGNLFTYSSTFDAVKRLIEQIRTPAPIGSRDSKILAHTLSTLRYGTPVFSTDFSKENILSSLFQRFFPMSSSSPIDIKSLSPSTFYFPPNQASLLPLIPSCMNDWYSSGIEKIVFSQDESHLILHWTEAKRVYDLPIHFKSPQICTFDFGGNIFEAAVLCKAVLNEDDELVLKITINYLELSSTRILKLTFQKGNLLTLRFEETPGIRLVFQMMEKNVPASVKAKIDLFRDMDYLWYRVDKVCTPALIGTTDQHKTN